MLGGYKMMFLRKKNKYEQLFIFLETYFHYELVEKNDKKESFFDKIVRCRYSSYKDLIENFENDNKKYLNEIFQNIDKISNDKLENFYKEFPQYVFVWG